MSVEDHLPSRWIIEGPLTLEVGREARTWRVRLIGELDLGSLPALESEVHRLLTTDSETVVLDLASLEFADSNGLGCLLQLARRSQTNGNRLRMLPARGELDRLLRLSGIHDVLPLIEQ